MRKLKFREIKQLAQMPQLIQACKGPLPPGAPELLSGSSGPAVSPTSPFPAPQPDSVSLPGDSCCHQDGDTWRTLSWGPSPADSTPPGPSPGLGVAADTPGAAGHPRPCST